MNDRHALQALLTADMATAHRQWMRVLQRTLGAFGLTGACALSLVMISRSDGGMHQVNLAELVGVADSSLVRHLDQLCAANLVERRQDRADRRAKTLWVTGEGRALAVRLEHRLGELRNDVLGHLSMEDLQATRRFATAMIDANRLP
jgi:MarR family transcriptional regulator for hemolysin